jgi:hypothetical protein
MCLEMGLHRRDALAKTFPDETQWPEVVKIFWSIYSLDRRWSFGTGLPFVIQDEDIDPNLPEPVRHFSPFLLYVGLLIVSGPITTVSSVHD